MGWKAEIQRIMVMELFWTTGYMYIWFWQRVVSCQGTNHHVLVFVSICLCIILSKWFFFSLRLLHEWELQSRAQRKSNTTRCVPSGSSSSNTHKGENGNKWKHSLEAVFLHQDHWLCDARDDCSDTFTESRESFDTEPTQATWFSHCKCEGSHVLGLFCGGFLIN